MKLRTLKERFEAKFQVTPGCWIWTASTVPDGYGQIGVDGKNVGAHRVSFELYNGPIPKGSLVRHKCDNPACVNPAHLLVGTIADNTMDKQRRGRCHDTTGTKNGRARLTETQVLKIKGDARATSEIAAQYGINGRHVRRIKAAERWSHL